MLLRCKHETAVYIDTSYRTNATASNSANVVVVYSISISLFKMGLYYFC